jgi:hypothetical protein
MKKIPKEIAEAATRAITLQFSVPVPSNEEEYRAGSGLVREAGGESYDNEVKAWDS